MMGLASSRPASDTFMSGFTRGYLPLTENRDQRSDCVGKLTIQTMINLLLRELFDRLDCLRQNTAHRGRGLIDAGQRGQRGGQIYRGYTSMILAGKEGRAIEGQRHMTVIGPWGKLCGSGKLPGSR